MDKSKQPKESKKQESIKKLIRIVDDNFKNKKYTTFNIFSSTTIFILSVFIYFTWFYVFVGVLLGAFPLLEEFSAGQISVVLSIFAILVAITALLFKVVGRVSFFERMSTEELAEWNYKAMKEKVNDQQRPLLKALIEIRCKQPDYHLKEMYKINPSFFDERKLLERLYE